MKGYFVILITGLIFLSFSCSKSTESKNQKTKNNEKIFSSNGEQIYFTGTSMRGTPISSEGIINSDIIACANCHGRDGKGKTIWVEIGTLKASDIRYKTLILKKHDHGENEEISHVHDRVHKPYNDDTLKCAITQGIDPVGNKLNPLMPKWKMSENDLVDLITFLKTL